MGFATYGQDKIPAEDREEFINVRMSKGAAREFSEALLDVVGGGKPDRNWLLWGVGMIAQSFTVNPGGPDHA